MMDELEIQPWFFQVEPYEGESISHFLGRFRRANGRTAGGLGQMVGLGAAIGRWEKFRFNPRPSQEQLEKLAAVVGVPTVRLWEMLPGAGVGIKMEPIRLCGACYGEVACHRMEWQFREMEGCGKHELRLLSECPNCGARFKVPALWADGFCHRCFTDFVDMHPHQKSY